MDRIKEGMRVKILLATGIEKFEKRLKDELVSLGYDVTEGYYREMDMSGFDTVVLSPALPGERDMVDLVYSLRERDIRVILLAGTMGGSELKQIVNMGVYDILFDPVRCADVIDILRNPKTFRDVASLVVSGEDDDGVEDEDGKGKEERIVLKEVRTVTRQQVVTWWSASGGEGKTTLAVAQAYLLARETKEKVALLDFSEVTPHCSWYLGLEPYDPMQLYDAIEKGELGVETLEESMVMHPKIPNLRVFTGVPFGRHENFKIEHYTAIIDALTTYPYVVIDTNPSVFFASSYAALRKASVVNVVVEPLYRALYDAREMIDFIVKTWKIPREILRVYVNKMCFEGLDLDTIRSGLNGVEIAGVVKYDPKVMNALNSGRPYTKGMEVLLKDLGVRVKRRRGLLGLFGRKRGDAVGAN